MLRDAKALLRRRRPGLRPCPPPLLSATVVVGIAGFQIALAAGAPGGRFAWGGAGGPGVLPAGLRVASAASVGLWLGAAGLLLRGDERATRRIAALLVVGSAMNAVSPSRVEARVWAPVSLALAGLTAAAGGVRPGALWLLLVQRA